jgi:hypothetical protein
MRFLNQVAKFSSTHAFGSRNGRKSPPSTSGDTVNSYRPSMLICAHRSGVNRSTSTSSTSSPIASIIDNAAR